MPTDTRCAAFDRELHTFYDLLRDQVLISQDRCVDALLDLYNAAPSAVIREQLAEMMSDMRYVSAVRVQLVRDDLNLLLTTALLR